VNPRLFIASSVERLDLAYATQEELEHNAECTVWNQGAFQLSQSTMANLLDTVSESDFGLFIFAPDDVTHLRGQDKHTVRDNVIFELGLFVGRLGAERSFLIAPAGANLHLPTDLLGITPASYTPDRQDGNLRAALGPACNRVRRAIARLGHFKSADVSGQSTTGPVETNVTDEGDIKALIQSWMGQRSTSDNSRAIKYADVDKELGIEPGSAKRLIAEIATRWNYQVAHQGEQTVLFERVTSGSSYF
jgi:hypothetical protein